MNTENTQQNALEDTKISVKVKIAALWASMMFFYIYVDHFGLFKPGYIENILAGKIFVFDITQTFILVGLFLTTIPALMIFLSVALPYFTKFILKGEISKARFCLKYTISLLLSQEYP